MLASKWSCLTVFLQSSIIMASYVVSAAKRASQRWMFCKYNSSRTPYAYGICNSITNTFQLTSVHSALICMQGDAHYVGSPMVYSGQIVGDQCTLDGRSLASESCPIKPRLPAPPHLHVIVRQVATPSHTPARSRANGNLKGKQKQSRETHTLAQEVPRHMAW